MQHLINFRMKSTIVYKTVNFQMPVESLCQLWFIQTFFYPNEEVSDYIVTKKIYFRDFLSFQFPRMRTSTFFENLGLKIVNIWKNQLKTWNTCQNMSSQHTLLSNLKHWLQFCRRFRTYSYPIIFHGLFSFWVFSLIFCIFYNNRHIWSEMSFWSCNIQGIVDEPNESVLADILHALLCYI